MFTWLDFFASSAGFLPHGHCYLWIPELLGLHAISDTLIAMAYATIPMCLIYVRCKRRDIRFNGLLACFSIFIVACGLTHGMEIVTLWMPVYWLAGAIKAVTAIASVTTAVLLIRLSPVLAALPNLADTLRGERLMLQSQESSPTAFILFNVIFDPSGEVVDLQW
jgi:hypothetical protein